MPEKHKRILLIGLMTVTTLPMALFVKLPDTSNLNSVALYISAALGYIGVGLMLWMYIIGTKSVIGLYFSDLPKILKVHSWLGKYGILFIFAHPIFVGIAYGENLLTYSLLPNLSSSFETSVTYGRIAIYALAIIWLTSAIVRGKIAYRPWKYIHYLAYIALPFGLLHIPDIGSSYISLSLPRVYFLSILALFILFSILRLRQLFGLGKVAYSVVKHIEVAPDVMLVKLRPNSRAVSIAKGQYLYLQINLLGEEHPFSVLHYDHKSREITIGYKVFGSFTEKMRLLPAGTLFYVDGPYGQFTEEINRSPDMPTVFIAGGIGVTPFVDHIMKGGSSEQWLFYANQTRQTSAFHDTLKSRLGNKYVAVLSRENTPAQDRDERGHLSSEILSKYLTHPTNYQYYICGPSSMMATARRSLIDMGVATKQIHSEEFGF